MSLLPSEVVDVFFRTTSLTPSRPDIVRQGRGREGVGDGSLYHLYTAMLLTCLACLACLPLPARLYALNHRMQVRHLLCCVWRVRLGLTR